MRESRESGGRAARIAITRGVSPALDRCELTHLAREPIDVPLARRQHAEYENRLAELGCTVRSLPAEPDLPDSVFVEDAAVVLDELAIITRPGAPSRRPETAAVAAALAPLRTLVTLEAPATLDGGDVLVLGRDVYVGRSRRTNADGVEQLRSALAPLGYSVTPVAVGRCLHLKSAVTRVGDDRLLLNPEWVDATVFTGLRLIEVDPAEPSAANALELGGRVIFPARFPGTLGRLRAAGIEVLPVDLSELARAEGGVTCCSLVFGV